MEVHLVDVEQIWRGVRRSRVTPNIEWMQKSESGDTLAGHSRTYVT